MSNGTTAVEDSSLMLPFVTAQSVASERGVGGRIRDEELGAQSSAARRRTRRGAKALRLDRNLN
jgi:hypothetical protein